jgi:HEAT repeat protein
MAKRQTTETKLARLKALRKDPHSAAALAELRKALADRSNYVAATAAEMIGEFEIRALVTDLVASFDRLMIDPETADPQCLGKAAIAEALVRLEHDDRELFLRGMSHFQPEPVWGGQQDSAAQVRGTCALGLVQSSTGDPIGVLNSLAELLVDSEKPARMGAARALASFGRTEAIPLLRLKIRLGDQAAEVLGECFAALLHLSPHDSIPLIAGFLNSIASDLGLEAAAALGESRERQAFLALKDCWQNHHDPGFKKSLLLAIGLSRQPDAVEFLLSLVRTAPADTAADALAALAPSRFHAPTCERIAAAVKENGHAPLKQLHEKLVGGEK